MLIKGRLWRVTRMTGAHLDRHVIERLSHNTYYVSFLSISLITEFIGRRYGYPTSLLMTLMTTFNRLLYYVCVFQV